MKDINHCLAASRNVNFLYCVDIRKLTLVKKEFCVYLTLKLEKGG